MGISKKSHSVLSDKETQSPMLKIFKDIMHREKNDSEKANLIKKEKQESKKRKTYSGPLPQSELRSYASSSTERFKRTQKSKVSGTDFDQPLYKQQNPDRSQSIPFNSEKRESWWFRKDADKKKKGNEDTCSCVSCALKKVVGSEYACLGCIALVFTVSVVVAFLVVFRTSVPECAAPHVDQQTSPTGGNTELLKSRRQFRSEGSSFNSKHWNDFATNPWRSLPKLSGSDELRDASLRDPIYQEESIGKATGTLSQILENDKFTDGLTSEKLRDFYKRLIQTDARIRKLKQQTEEVNHLYNPTDITTPNPERYKRSLMSINTHLNGEPQKRDQDYDNKIDLSKFKLFYPPFVAVKDYTDDNRKARIKRLDDEVYNDPAPSGILIENKKLMVQYGPIDRKRNFPKCSHLPKDAKSHETQLKHPFYKNSQRLDELLGQILDKNLDKVIANPFNFDLLFGEKEKCKHTKFESKGVNKNSDGGMKLNKNIDEATFADVKKKHINSESTTSFFERNSLHMDKNDETESLYLPSSTSSYDAALSMSKLQSPDTTEVGKLLKYGAGVPANKRKLMQLNEEDDETLGYEDFKEVLSDYTDTHDEADKQVERDRRSDESSAKSKREESPNKYNMPSIHNTNWKGSMQLYPDELNMMINNAAIQSMKNELENDVKRMSDERVKIKSADTDYVEDYLNNKYSKLAQAYSDYGVLSGKKEFGTMENSVAANHKALHHEYQKEKTPAEREVTEKNNSYKKRRNLKSPFQEYEDENLTNNTYNATNTHSKELSNASALSDRKSYELPDKENKMNSIMDKFNKLKQNFKIGNANDKKLTIQSASRKQRSLKSVDINNLYSSKSDELNFGKAQEIDKEINKHKDKEMKSVEKNASLTKTEDSPKDFLRLFSDWFLTLAKLSGEYKENFTTIENSTVISLKETSTPDNVTKDMMYPMYDADMIENIGHRSRVLMSVQDLNVSSLALNGTNMAKITPVITDDSTDTVTTLTTPSTKSSVTTQVNVNGSNNSNTTSAFHAEMNKTVVKRDVASNLIFWNDLYDDEYGVKIDYFDNEKRKKHSADKDGLMKRSGKWINRKFKKLGESIRSGYSSNRDWRRRTTNMRISRGVINFRSKRGDGLFKRKEKFQDDEPEKPLDFRKLNAKMKVVCREAIQAVKKTRNLNEENQGDAEAASLMQQLVKLMSDLVDFQVQQKTCSKLPPDLQEFLAWLVASSDSVNTRDHSLDVLLNDATTNDHNTINNKEVYTVPEMFVANTPEQKDPKMEYHDVLNEIQSLLNLYDDLSFEEKSKLPGVKEYLQNHMNYILKVLSLHNEYNLPTQMMKYNRKRNAPLRYKRHMFQKAGALQSGARTIYAPYIKRIRRYTKKSDAKHSKTTVNYFDSFVTDGVRKKKQVRNATIVTTTEKNNLAKVLVSTKKTIKL